MPARIVSASPFGFACELVEIEVDILSGTPSINIVGLGDTSVQESKERIRSAIKNSGAEYPRKKKTVNLAPAHLRKHGPMFDLPIALGLLMQSGQIPAESLQNTAAIGELGLNGDLRPIAGVLSMVLYLQKRGIQKIILPPQNAQEASLIEDITIYAPANLREIIQHAKGDLPLRAFEKLSPDVPAASEFEWRFEDIAAHEEAKRALMIAAAGGHNILLTGPPGSGKTMLARCLPSIMPPLTFTEAIETTKIYSIANQIDPAFPLIQKPPFRAIHHTASAISLIGGGSIPRPGEISLSHNGILFLDELLEFPRGTLESLRQPLEDHLVHISRAKGSTVFPARFMLIAGANPCACGFEGDPDVSCTCSAQQRDQFIKKISGPLLDRIDMRIVVPRLSFEEFWGASREIESVQREDSSSSMRDRVTCAREVQIRRFAQNESQSTLNSSMKSRDIDRHCSLDKRSEMLLQSLAKKMPVSGRGFHRILKVARTIADLESASAIGESHIAEAIQYRVGKNTNK